MHTTASLNDLYADFSAGLLEKRELEKAIYQTLDKEIQPWPGIGREDYEDFISWLYTRINRAITAYRQTGSSFEAYIGTLVRLTAKEYRLRLLRSRISESSAWITQITELRASDVYVCEQAPYYADIAEAVPVDLQKMKNSRQLLILVLKCCNYVSDDFLERVSPRLGIQPEVLYEMVDRLREQRIKREGEINLLRERVTCQFFRCVVHEKTMENMPHDSPLAQMIHERQRRGRIRLAKMRRRLEQLRPDPSNLQIAKVLGVSKGTVDSALYHLKAKRNPPH